MAKSGLYGDLMARKPFVRLEKTEQIAFCEWLTLKGYLYFAIPNGGHRHPAVAAKLKAEGATPGVPDLFIPQWRTWD